MEDKEELLNELLELSLETEDNDTLLNELLSEGLIVNVTVYQPGEE
jgi:hypothetical protein